MSAPVIDVVIPVYRNLDLTQQCVASVLRADDPAMGTVIVVNDASPEPALAAYCRDLAEHASVCLIENDDNQGFVRSVNAGLEHATARDVVILNSDTEVPAGWLTRLASTAEKNPSAASITPFSNNATICSYPNFCEEASLPEGLALHEIDALFAKANAGQAIEIPTGVGFCMYLRRAAIEDVGGLDAEAFGRGYGEENDWCMRARAKGWTHLLAADVYVYHAGGASFGDDASGLQKAAQTVLNERYPQYEQDIAAFVERDPPEEARYAVDAIRPDSHAVIADYRKRARAERDARYALDRARHDQVVALDRLLQETRAAAEAESARYEAILASEREQTAATEARYQQQVDDMAEGYAALEKEHQRLNGLWVVRLWKAFNRLWSRS